MNIIEIAMICEMIALGIVASVSDIRFGIVANKMIVIFLVIGIIMNFLYFGILQVDIRFFFLNIAIVSAISILLYATHTLAGGDSKLLPVISILYPAGMYITYASTKATLVLAVGISIFYGFIFLLISSVIKLLMGKTHIEKEYVRTHLLTYLKSYITAAVYVTLINLGFKLAAGQIIMIPLASHILLITCMVVAWLSGRVRILGNKLLLSIAIITDIALSIYMNTLPISIDPRTYIFTAAIVLCQMIVRTNLYESVKVSELKPGMILSMYSSLAMQSSRVRGLPRISFEDLRSRLTENEVQSIHRWAETAKGSPEVIVVKKIPFAVFITMGYISYFLLWRLLT